MNYDMLDKSPEERLWSRVLADVTADAVNGDADAVDWFMLPKNETHRMFICMAVGVDPKKYVRAVEDLIDGRREANAN